jgi:hypothetical protein
MNKLRASVISHAVKKELSMPRSLKSTILATVMGLIALAAMTNNAFACSINPNFQSPPKSELVDNADIVVIGKVIGGGVTGGTISGSSTILVEKYLKGNGPDILFTKALTLGLMGCGGIPTLWSREVLYYRADQQTADPTSPWQIWEYAGRDSVDSVTIAEIRNYTGQMADPVPSPSNIRFAAFLLFFRAFEIQFITSCVLIPLGILLAIFLVRRALHRRKRMKMAMQI